MISCGLFKGNGLCFCFGGQHHKLWPSEPVCIEPQDWVAVVGLRFPELRLRLQGKELRTVSHGHQSLWVPRPSKNIKILLLPLQKRLLSTSYQRMSDPYSQCTVVVPRQCGTHVLMGVVRAAPKPES